MLVLRICCYTKQFPIDYCFFFLSSNHLSDLNCIKTVGRNVFWSLVLYRKPKINRLTKINMKTNFLTPTLREVEALLSGVVYLKLCWKSVRATPFALFIKLLTTKRVIRRCPHHIMQVGYHKYSRMGVSPPRGNSKWIRKKFVCSLALLQSVLDPLLQTSC